MKRETKTKLLFLLVGLFGVLAFVCASCAARKFPVQGSRFPVEEGGSEFPKLSEP